MPIRVVVVDDTDDIRFLLKLAFKLDGRFEVVGEGANGKTAVELAASLRPDALVLDVAMPIMDGLQALPEIKRVSPETKVMILSGFNLRQVASDALKRGADGYIEKGTKPSEICAKLAEIAGIPSRDNVPLVTGKSYNGEGDGTDTEH